jgi:hypothetical protein
MDMLMYLLNIEEQTLWVDDHAYSHISNEKSKLWFQHRRELSGESFFFIYMKTAGRRAFFFFFFFFALFFQESVVLLFFNRIASYKYSYTSHQNIDERTYMLVKKKKGLKFYSLSLFFCAYRKKNRRENFDSSTCTYIWNHSVSAALHLILM